MHNGICNNKYSLNVDAIVGNDANIKMPNALYI